MLIIRMSMATDYSPAAGSGLFASTKTHGQEGADRNGYPLPVKVTIGREKQGTPIAPSAVGALALDSKDFAIVCLGIALLFTTLAVVSLAARRQPCDCPVERDRRG